MTVIDRQARDLIDLCRRLGNQDQEEEQFDRLTLVMDQLLRRQRELDSALAFLRQAAEDGLPFAEERKSLEAGPLGAALAKARAALAEQTAYDHGPVDEALRPLDEFARRAVILAGRVWAAYWQGAVPQGRRDLLDALAQLPDLRSQVESLRKLEDEVQGLTRREVPSPLDYAKFRSLVADLNERWTALPLSPDPEVENFLTKAATGGAGVNDLTQTVRDWLDERGLADQFLIQPGTPG